jgi:actinin alpha
MTEGDPKSKLLMEKTWERIQKKTFTGWCNNHLRKRALKIEDIETDLSDGLLLIALLEIISDETFPFKYEKKPKMKIQNVGNVGYCLKFIEQKGVKLAGIGAEEIVDSNLKMILGMIWTIILRFAIQDISLEELSARDALLLWCQRKTEGYPGVNVKNFHMSFQDGLALCALIHRHRPDLLDYHALDRADKANSLETAFRVAEKDLDIPRLLDVADMLDVPKPDERSVITYVSMYYHVFASSEKAEAAGRRVASVIDFNAANDKIKADYLLRTSNLLDWISDNTDRWNNLEAADSIQGVEGQIKDLTNFKANDKPPKAAEKTDLEASFNALQTKLTLNNRPPFVPDQGKAPADVDRAWAGLEKAEHARNLALREELRRLKRIKELSERFTRKANVLEKWIDEKSTFLQREPLGDNISEVNARLKNHEGYVAEKDAQEDSLVTLRSIAQDLKAANFDGFPAISKRLSSIENKWVQLGGHGDDRKQRLEDKLAELQRIEGLLLDFAKRSLAMRVFLDRSEEDLTEPITVESVSAVNELSASLDDIESGVQQREGEYSSLESLCQQCQEAGVAETTFSEVSFSSLSDKWNNVQSLIAQRRSDLAGELEKQQGQDELRSKFASAASAFLQYTSSQGQAIGALSGSAEEQLSALSAITSGLHSDGKPQFDALVVLDRELVDGGVFENPMTEATIESLKSEWDSLNTIASQKHDVLTDELHSQSQSGLSKEQLAEFQECFEHFDKNKDSLLDRLEFGACLRSLGQEVSLDQGSKLDDIIKSIDGDADGQITFNEFCGYMEQVSTTKDTPQDLKNAFKIIAGDKDFITEQDMRMVLPAEKVEYLISNMQPYPGVEGGYDYASFSASMYA